MLRWLRTRRSRAGAIDAETWARTLARLPFLAARTPQERMRLHAMAEDFLARKTVSGAAGVEPDDDLRAMIAAQACLPVLQLGLQWYRDFVEIVVYPGAFRAPRRLVDDDGVVHEWTDDLAGEAMEGGPVVLSWDDIDGAGRAAGCSVVIHEFAHKLDLADGEADGCPPMPAAQAARWRRVLHEAHESFAARLDAVEAAIPADLDPEGAEADRFYAALPLDPYAATDPAEFFAVASEVFFVDNARLRAAFAPLDAAMRTFYRQHP